MFVKWLPLLLCISAAFAAERKFDFSEFRTNETPSGFRSAVTVKGQPGDWKVIVADVPPIVAPLSAKAPVETKRGVVAQLSNHRDDTRAPLLIYDTDAFNDFTFSTRFKIVSGEVEQMAGIAFRLQDERNYYYVRANAKDRNVAFFRYVAGELIGPVSVPAEVKTNEWNQLAIECRGSKFRALLNDREAIPWTEPKLIPFPDGSSKGVFAEGKIAFWTKADSVVYFADARLDYTPREPFAQALVRETMQVHPRLIGLKIFGLTTNANGTRIIASTDANEIGQPGEQLERDCIEKGGSYFGKGKEVAMVTMPLHDRNGETVGAVRIIMTTFLGQTERNGLARARPIVKAMALRVSSAKELLQ
jgi:hypothetical protein